MTYCKAKVAKDSPDYDQRMAACARKPARAFITNRSPAALLVGDLGATEGSDGAYDPDRLVIHTSIPLSAGPSRVYLAPIVDRDGGSRVVGRASPSTVLSRRMAAGIAAAEASSRCGQRWSDRGARP